MKYVLIGLLAMLTIGPVCAEPMYVSLNISSYHYDRSRHLNERNPGLGIRFGNWNMGYYYNSHYRHSTYALRSYLSDAGSVKYGVFLGGVTGYKRAPVLPALGLQAIVPVGTASINLMATPKVPGVADGFIGFQILVRR